MWLHSVACLRETLSGWLPGVPSECTATASGWDTNFLSMTLTLLALFSALFIRAVVLLTGQ